MKEKKKRKSERKEMYLEWMRGFKTETTCVKLC